MFYAISDSAEEKNRVLQLAHEKSFLIDKFVTLGEIDVVGASDTIVVNDMTAFGQNFVRSLSVCVSIVERGGKIIFVSDPNLSVLDEPMAGVFKSILNLERKFISIRTKAGLKAAKASGAKMGRPKGSANKLKSLDAHKAEIQDYLKKDISLRSVMKIINHSLEKPLSYFTYRRYAEALCK